MTQTDDVLQALRMRGDLGLTPQEALYHIGTMRLAARISDVKEMLPPDEEIVTLRATSNGKTYARYVLRRRVPVPAPATGTQESIW
jgi:hypothetical protein